MQLKRAMEFVWLTSPKSFIGNTKVEAVEVSKMKLGDRDSSRQKKTTQVAESGSEYKVKADLVIKSLGFDPEKPS